MSTFIIEIVLAKIKTIIYPPRVSNPCRSKISIVVILYFFHHHEYVLSLLLHKEEFLKNNKG